MLEKMRSLIKRKKISYLKEALVELDLYSEWWNYITEKFADNTQVFQLIKKVEDAVEVNLIKGGQNGDYNSTLTIFILKNKHGFTDKQETTIKGAVPLVIKDDIE